MSFVLSLFHLCFSYCVKWFSGEKKKPSETGMCYLIKFYNTFPQTLDVGNYFLQQAPHTQSHLRIMWEGFLSRLYGVALWNLWAAAQPERAFVFVSYNGMNNS